MKKLQTFKLDPELLTDMKKEANKEMRPFNNYVEMLLLTHPYRFKQKTLTKSK